MKIIRVIIAFIVALATFSLFYELLIILGGKIIKYFNIDTASEFGANMVATNTLVSFIIALFFAVMIFKIIKGKKEKNNEI